MEAEFGLALSVGGSEAQKDTEVARADVGASDSDEEVDREDETLDDEEGDQLDDESEDLDDEDEEDVEEGIDVAEVQMPLAKEIYKYDEWLLGSLDDFQDIKQDLQVLVCQYARGRAQRKEMGARQVLLRPWVCR